MSLSSVAEGGASECCKSHAPVLSQKFVIYSCALRRENGYVESFHGRLRDERLGRELFLSLPEARGVLDQWRWTPATGGRMAASRG